MGCLHPGRGLWHTVSNFRVHVIIISALLCLAIFWAGSSLYEAHGTEEPLRELLSGHPAVREVDVRRAEVWEVQVQLHRTDDLRATYQDLIGTVEEVVPPDQYRLSITNDASGELLVWWDELSLYVYEAASNATFTQMRDRVSAAAGGDVNVSLQVDAERIYLHLRDGDDDLYRVIERIDREGGEAIE